MLMLAAVVPAAAAPAIRLKVDATQAPLKILHTHMVLPVSAGPLTLYYPKWIPGEHAPSGPVVNLTGLKISADGKGVPWRRDLLDMFTFHVDVPAGVTALDIHFDYIEPAATSGFSAGSSATAKMLVVSWNQNVLYPAGRLAQDMTFEPTLRLPAGWKFGTALPVEKQDGDEIQFKPVELNRLVDSPVIAGEYLSVVDVTPPGEPLHHEMDIAADSEAALQMSPELRQNLVNLVAETGKLFGARHYRDYHFLLSLSDHVAHFGLEHHESDDSRVPERSLIDPQRRELVASLLPHEFVHSWNGKFRRPKDLSPPYYEEPQETDLLWVYEGLTNYLGDLLAERCGLWTPRQYREYLALTAAELGPGRPGRTWRPLQDTADAAQILYYAPHRWVNWRRSTDYYPEGDLVWLEVDTIIRRESRGTKSLTDFLHEFYGGPNNGPELKPYTFDDLVHALNNVQPYDWAAYFHKRLNSTSPEAPLGGIENGGWKVVYNDSIPGLLKAREETYKTINALYSIGLELNEKGVVQDSVAGMPAYQAGISPGMKVVAVNGRAFTKDVFHDALKATADSSGPLQLLVLNDEYYKTVSLDYHGGERYPHLVREEGKPDLLGEIEKPLARP
jgi:predicted metalloprotease with PDZ domain